MDRGVFKAILLAVVVVGLIALTFAIYAPFLVAMLWGAVLVTATYPVYERLLARTSGRATLAATLMTIAVIVVIILPFAALAPRFVAQAREFVDTGWDHGREILKEKVKEEGTALHAAWTWLRESFDENLKLDDLRGPGKFAIGLARDTVEMVLSAIVSLFFLVIVLFYFFRDGPQAVHVVREVLPLKKDQCDLVLRDMRDAINAAVRGGLLTALVQGVLGAAILAILGLDGWVFWGAIIALAGLIPIVGTSLVWAPMAVFLWWQGHPGQAAILAAYGALVIGSADNFLRPILVGQKMKAHPMLLFFGILGSITLFGFKGIVLGPLVVAALSASTTLFRREFAAEAEGE